MKRLVLDTFVACIGQKDSPVPQGSMKHVRNQYTGRIYTIPSNAGKLNAWRKLIGLYARRDADPMITRGRGVAVEYVFFFRRPKGHHTKTGCPSSQWRAMPGTRPDLDKLVRAVNDALTGIVFEDDSQVVQDMGSRKMYADGGVRVGVRIKVWVLDEKDF